jgi:hypothetical protein
MAPSARETDGDGAPSLPLEKGRVSRSTIYRTLWRFHSLEAATLTTPAAGVARSNAYHSPVSQIAQIKTARCSLMFKKKQKKALTRINSLIIHGMTSARGLMRFLTKT